ncbi:MAG: asparagine synthetase B, partial [Bacteroidota bacterium]|nr:asparagine synthetase B [Bacteroidota bacterium]
MMETFRRMGLTLVGCVLFQALWAARILVPMDDSQTNHLKAYGVAFWVLENGVEVEWLLNYRGGSFLLPNIPEIQNECVIRGVSHQVIA